MRLRQALSGLIILGFLFALAPTMAAAPGVPPEKATGTTPPSDEIHSTKVMIAPHRAIYDMSLASVKNGSNITGVSGRMLFEWRDVCDGWAVQQHLKLHFTYAEGDESDVTSTELTWESKDGKQYTFNIRRISDGKETERYVGKAIMNADGSGTVTYSVPEKKKADLPAGTIFPSAHTKMIIEKALAGEKLFSRPVFDGSDDPGIDDVSVFINASEAQTQKADNPKLKSSLLLNQTAWPVRMAFFKLDTETGEPDYEMNLNLLSNGVARKMMIDYGDFSVTGTLSDIEPLPTGGCS